MANCTRRFLLTLSLGTLGTAISGCDMGALTYFLMPEQRMDPVIKHLASKDEKKVPTVLIITWSGLEMRTEAIHADRQLAELLATQIKTLADGASEKINFVPIRKVEEFKNSNPNWRAMQLAEIGRKFGADYVISLEMNNLNLYETGSAGTLYRGRANITVSLADVTKPDDPPNPNIYTCEFPGEARGAIDTTGLHPMQFRQRFLTHIAKQLSFYFSRYPRSERYQIQ